MAASAGTVTLELDANSVKLIRELQKAQRQTKRSATQMRRDIQRSFAAMGKAAAGFTVAVGAAVKLSINFADKIAKTADKLGIGVEALQEFRYAAKRAGIEQNTLDMALQRFTRRAAEAANGTGEAKKALEELGIELRDGQGNMRKTEDLLRDVADAFQRGYSPADQLRIAFKLFDSEGAGLVNMLRDGSKGLDEMKDAAHSLGLVMEERLVRNAEEAADKMEDLQRTLQIRIATAVTENTDSIIALTDALITFVGWIGKATKGWNDWLAAQGVGVQGIEDIQIRGNALLEERLELEDRIAALRERAAEFEGSPLQLNFLRQITQAQIKLNGIIEEQIALQNEAVKLQREPFTEGEEAPTGTRKLDPKQVVPKLLPLPSKAEWEKRADEIADIIKGLQDEVRSYGMGDEAVLFQLIDLNATQEQKNAVSDLLGQLKALELEEENRQAAAQERTDLENEYKQLVQSTLTDIEQHAAVIDRINLMYQEGIIPSVEDYAEVVKRVNDEFVDKQQKQASDLDEFGKQAARNMQDALSQFLFDPFDEGVEGMVRGFARAMQQMAAEAAAAALMKKLFGGEGDAGVFGSEGLGGFLAGIFGGGKALGGPVEAGKPYLVGENGPELIVPRNMGTVIPNHQLAANSTTVTNVYLPPQAQPRTATQTAYEVANRQRRAVSRNR